MAPRKAPFVGGKIQSPSHSFSSWNEVSSERGQWETSGVTCSPQSFLFLGQIPGPQFSRTSERPAHWQQQLLKLLSIYWVFSPSPFSFLQQSLLPTLVLCRNLPLLSLPKITLLKQQCGNPISPQGCIPLLPASPLSFFRAELQTYSQSLDKLHLFIYILVIFWDFGSARMRTLVCFHHKVSPSFWNCTQQKLSKYVCNK